MTGLDAYQTYLAFCSHFNKKLEYDGWKYNFKGKCSQETFDKMKHIKFQFEGIGRKATCKNDLLRFFYPSFANRGYVKTTDIRLMTFDFNKFNNVLENNFHMDYCLELNSIVSKLNDYKDILKCEETLPFIYEEFDKGNISYESIVILSIFLPELNNIASNEPLVWNNFLSKLKFDLPFYRLYIDDERKELYKGQTIDILKNI